MAATKKPAAKAVKPARVGGVETRVIPLSDITDNSAQSRGMGVCSRLKSLGYGVFEAVEANGNPPLWGMLFSDKPEDVKAAVRLIQEHEPELADLAESLEGVGQLEPIGVTEYAGRGDGGTSYDVLYGMRRCLALALNHALGKAPDAVEARVFTFEGKPSPAWLRLMALEENDNRQDESPIDRAMTYKDLKEEGMTAKEIASRTRQSDQSVFNYLKLLDPKLEDKRLAIHTRALSVEKALALLANRKGRDYGSERAPSTNGRRDRLPGVKGLIKIYDAKERPKNMEEEEWSLWTTPEVRRLLAYRLGLKFSEWTPPKKAVGEDGEAAGNGAPARKGKILKVKKERAIQLLISLGKANARTWGVETLASKLESLPNLVEPGQQAETPSLQKLLDTLLANYADGLKVVITTL